MQELIKQLTDKFGVSEEQAAGIIDTVKNYFSSNTSTAAADVIGQAGEGIVEKATHFVEDHIPAGLKEKTEELVGGVKNKIKNLF